MLFTAKLLEGTLFQDPSPTCVEFLSKAIQLYSSPRYQPFLIISLIHPEEERKLELDEVLSPDLIYYMIFDYHTVLPWIKEEMINLSIHSENPFAIRHLEKHQDKINYKRLCLNHAAGHLLWEKRDDPEIFDWYHLCKNTADEAIWLMEMYPEYIQWPAISTNQNPAILSFLEKNIQHIYWSYLSRNPIAIPLLIKYPENIDWTTFSGNPSAIPYLIQHPERINLHELCCNHNATELIIERLDQFLPVDWRIISRHPSIVHILDHLINIIGMTEEQLVSKLDWSELSKNSCVIEFLIKYPSRILNHIIPFTHNRHPSIVEKLIGMIGEVNLRTQILENFRPSEILRNPSAIEYVESIKEYLITADNNILWKKLAHNPGIYCPPL